MWCNNLARSMMMEKFLGSKMLLLTRGGRGLQGLEYQEEYQEYLGNLQYLEYLLGIPGMPQQGLHIIYGLNLAFN